MSPNPTPARALLYQMLAEALAEPAPWLAGAGREWPLFEAALRVADEENLDSLNPIIVELAGIGPESLNQRRKRYRRLLENGSSQPVHIHESLAKHGRLAGPITFEVWSLYNAVGLNVGGTDLPDHVSLELSFMAFMIEQEQAALAERGQWRRARRAFYRRHAGQWMPELGRAVSRSGDSVYAPIGALLTAAIRSEIRPRRKPKAQEGHPLPLVTQPDRCTLCGFCVQVCPTRTMAICETFEATTLVIHDTNCVSCNKCVKVCPTHALELSTEPVSSHQRTLYQSPRARCPVCGEPTVSQAELDTVAAQIGSPRWLYYCMECRTALLEEIR